MILSYKRMLVAGGSMGWGGLEAGRLVSRLLNSPDEPWAGVVARKTKRSA